MISLKNFAQNTYSTIGVGYLQSQPQTQLNPQDWHYVAVTKSGLNGNVYIDGVLASSSTYSNVPYIWNSLLLGATQGCVSCSPVPTYLGMIDEVRISNTVRTASEIQNNFNGNSPFTSDANTLGLFHFDSNTGTTITNSAGSNNGVLYGGVSFDNGKFGLGLSFDGIDDYSRISQSIPVNNMTVEFWYKSSDNDAVLAMMEYAYNTGIYLGTSSISCEVPTGSLANGMVAYYPFCGNANDGSGNANNGTVNGATLTTDRYGNPNSAYSFDGVSNYIRVDNTLISNSPTSYTISAWYNTQNYSASNGDGRVLISDRNTGLCSYKYTMGFTTNHFLNGVIYDCNGPNGDSVGGDAGLDNNWHNTVFIYDNSLATIFLYIDGVLVNTTTNVTKWSNMSNPTNIGYWNGFVGAGGFFEGKIDDIGIWNRALSQQEITNLYNNNLSTNSVVNSETKISIYPNPTNSLINIDFSNTPDYLGSDIRINNMLGQEIYHSKLTEQIEKILLGSIAKSGLYIIHITDRNGKIISTKKVILQ